MALDQAVLAVLRAHGTAQIWHYTRCSSLPGIIEHGAIYARAELGRRGIVYQSTHYYGTGRHEELLSEYVSCAPLPPWGMMQSEEEQIAVLRLDSEVMAIQGTCFCPGWSPRGDFDPDEIVGWTGPERLEELYTGPGPMFVLPSEIFVPAAIPVTMIQAILFFDKPSLRAARGPLLEAAKRRSTPANHTISFGVDRGRFPRSWRESGPPWEEPDVPTI